MSIQSRKRGAVRGGRNFKAPLVDTGKNTIRKRRKRYPALRVVVYVRCSSIAGETAVLETRERKLHPTKGWRERTVERNRVLVKDIKWEAIGQ